MKQYKPNGHYSISSPDVDRHLSNILKGQLITDISRMMSGQKDTEIDMHNPSIVDVMLIVSKLIIDRDRHDIPIPEDMDQTYGKLLSKIVTNTIKTLDKQT